MWSKNRGIRTVLVPRCKVPFLAFSVGGMFGWIHEKGARKRLFYLVYWRRGCPLR